MRVPAVCAYPKKLEELAQGNQLTWPRALFHYSKRFLVRTIPRIPELFLCFVHAPCICNEVVSAVNRVLAKNPPMRPEGLRAAKRAARRLCHKLKPIQPMTYEQVINTFKGPRKTRYFNAWQSLISKPICEADGRISSFIKSEKTDPGAKVNPDPRMIQARTPRYGVEIARYLKPMEHQLYNITGGKSDDRLIAKGLNQVERAQLLRKKWESFKNPVCLGLDCSRWDRHVTKEMIQLEHSVYLRMCSDPHFARLLGWQLHNKCRTSNGVKYSVKGNRMSGDMNTALGNCLLMVILITAAMDILKLEDWDLLDDGDDCLLIIESDALDHVKSQLPKIFADFGHELKVESVAHDIHDIVFCQCRYLRLADREVMVANWIKTLSTGTSGTKNWDLPSVVPSMLHAVGSCYMALGAGVPIVQPWAARLIELGNGKYPKAWNTEYEMDIRIGREMRFWKDWANIKAQDIPEQNRAEFERAFGVDPTRQLEIEKYLSTWNPNFLEYREVSAEWDSAWQERVSPDLIL